MFQTWCLFEWEDHRTPTGIFRCRFFWSDIVAIWCTFLRFSKGWKSRGPESVDSLGGEFGVQLSEKATIETPLRISVEPLLQLTEYLCFKYSITVFDRAYFLWPYSQAFRSISTDGQHPNLEQRNALLGSWCDLADHQPFIPTRNLVVWLGWALRGSGPWGQTAKRGRKTNWLVHCLPVFLDETVAGYRWVSCFTYEWVAWCNLWRSDKRAFVQRGLFSGIISLSVCDIS